LSITRSEISNGHSLNAPGAAVSAYGNSVVTITDSLVANNWADASSIAPAIENFGSLTLINSTVSGDARHGTSGVAISSLSGPVVLKNATVTGYAIGLSLTSAPTTVDNSIIIGNGQMDCYNATAELPVTYTGRNLMGTHHHCGPRPEDYVGEMVTHRFGALLDNGGLTATYAVSADSVAVRAGINCAPTHDQRGVVWPAACTLGAHEPTLSLDKSVAGVFEAGQTLTYTLQLRAPGAVPLASELITDTVPAPLSVVPGSASATTGEVLIVGDTVTWTGPADPVDPPVISFRAMIDPGAPPQVITNTAKAEWQGFREISTFAIGDMHTYQFLPGLARSCPVLPAIIVATSGTISPTQRVAGPSTRMERAPGLTRPVSTDC